MLKTKTTDNVLLMAVKEIITALKFVFQSNNNREFRRLKDFICSKKIINTALGLDKIFF
jgi:hypothetical protein